MHARTWIILGLLAGAAIAVHRASHAETAPIPVPRHDAEPSRDVTPRLDPGDELIEHVATAPTSRMAELAEVLVAGVEIDDPPTMQPYARPAATGALAGKIRDLASGEEIAAVTVLVTSPSLDGTQSALTDEHGYWIINELPPGTYLETFYYMDAKVEVPDVVVVAGWTASAPRALDCSRPPIFDEMHMVNIPVTRTFEPELGGTGDEQADLDGVSFSGDVGIESSYVADGEPTSDL